MTASAKLLGSIVRLQIQRASLKVPAEPEERYDPAGLWSVPDLTLTASGAQTLLPNGDLLLDVHNAAHPHSKNVRGFNDLSIGFTGHYAAMREHFGPHLTDGISGEAILVALERQVALEELKAGVEIETAAGRVALRALRVAKPCSPFSKFACRSVEPAAVKEALQFLGDGRRGFYCGYEGAEPVTIAIGDRVWSNPG